jgi:hypothetical protein
MTKNNQSKKQETKPNKIMNSNIINNQNIYNNNLNSVLGTSNQRPINQCFQTPPINLLCNNNLLKKSKAQIEQEMFGDFKLKFYEANLHKIISWEELKSIAMAIGNRDWGYVKYILTIICLMLKSYQSISDSAHCESEHKENVSNQNVNDNVGVEGVIDKIKELDISKPNELEKPLVQDGKKRELSEAEVKEQLKSLNNIFKKMKNIDVQMNISNCWNCYNKLCTLHTLGSNITPGVGAKELNLQQTLDSEPVSRPPRL